MRQLHFAPWPRRSVRQHRRGDGLAQGLSASTQLPSPRARSWLPKLQKTQRGSSCWITTEENCKRHPSDVTPVIRYLPVFALDPSQKAETGGFACWGWRGGLVLRWAEIWWGFTGMGTAPSNRPRCLFTLRVAKSRWVSEAGAVCSAIGTNAIWQPSPEEISLLPAPLGTQGTKVAMKNTAHGGFNFKLVKMNFKHNEVMLEIKLWIWKLCMFGKLRSKYPKHNMSGQKAKKKHVFVHVDLDTVSRGNYKRNNISQRQLPLLKVLRGNF